MEKLNNSLVYIGNMNKLAKKRIERLDNRLSKVKQSRDTFTVITEPVYTFTTKEYGTIHYFPKVDKIYIRKENRWNYSGLKWLLSYLIIP